MKIIIPIGGGEIDNSSHLIDKKIVSLVNKDIKKVLFIPIASGDYPPYIEKFTKLYEDLGCTVDTLYLSRTDNDNLIRSKIFGSDIIYIGGGNSGKMMRIFKRTGLINYLKEAYEREIILTGISAGAIAYFESGYSDANRSTDINASLTLVKGINLIPYCLCPHYNDKERASFDEFINNNNMQGIALDNEAAMLYVDGEIKGIIKGNDKASGYIIKDLKKELIRS